MATITKYQCDLCKVIVPNKNELLGAKVVFWAEAANGVNEYNTFLTIDVCDACKIKFTNRVGAVVRDWEKM